MRHKDCRLRNGRYGRDPRLTKEQEAIRLQGLRLLARMIVRAHLGSLIEEDARGNGSVPATPSALDTSVAKEEKDAG